MSQFADLVAELYQQQLGREADPEGAAFWAGALASGTTPEQVAREMAQSLEGQNLLTQAITSAYRSELGRNPEQEGYQFWQSSALDQGLSAREIQDAVRAAAVAEQQQRGITGGFTQMQLPDLEADPFGGRRATTSIDDLPQSEADRINISYINGIPVQFVNPVTQQQYISQFGQGAWNAVAGDETISKERITEAVGRAFTAGSLTRDEYSDIVKGLADAKSPEQVRQVLGIPQGAVIIDPKYGQQIGEDNDLQIALAEAAKRQAVLSAQDPNYYQASDVLGQAYLDAGLDWPFMGNTYKANTMMTQANLLNQQNLMPKVNQVIKDLTAQFGPAYDMTFGGESSALVPQSTGYYSEAGLQPGFTPFGTEGTTFRSGVAGYIPETQLPVGFQFGAPPVNVSFQQYRPGAFQPTDVTTGGYITGYNPNGTPIYSTYNNPNTNVGGTQSTLNPFTPVQAGAIGDLQAQIAALQFANTNNNFGSAGG